MLPADIVRMPACFVVIKAVSLLSVPLCGHCSRISLKVIHAGHASAGTQESVQLAKLYNLSSPWTQLVGIAYGADKRSLKDPVHLHMQVGVHEAVKQLTVAHGVRGWHM